MHMQYKDLKSGEFYAGVVAAGVAGFFIGIVLLIYGMVDDFDPIIGADEPVFLNLASRATIVIWIVGWVWLHISWRKAEIEKKRAGKVATFLISVGILASAFTIIKYITFGVFE